MMRTLCCLILLCGQLSLSGQTSDYPQDYFRSPLDIPLVLSGTFGELRSNHFHSGVDIKTQGRTGLDIHAVGPGQVRRIKISPYGFGKAIYIEHPNGYTSVYAHLQSFNDSIEAYLKKRQYDLQSNEVDLYLPEGTFRVERGTVIAKSGNSGGSGGPHLHFELRDSRTEKIINPLLFGMAVADQRFPVLKKLHLYEYRSDELISGTEHRLLHRGSGKYDLAGSGTIETANLVGFGIDTYDQLDGAGNKNGVYRIQLFVNETLEYDFQMNTFAFSETRYINSHIDFAQAQCCGDKVNKLFIDPANQLSVYGRQAKMNLLDLAQDSSAKVCIKVSDLAGNQSELTFKVERQAAEPPVETALDGDMTTFKAGQTNFFVKEDLELVLPENALYRDVLFEYNKEAPCAQCLSEVYKIGSELIPVHAYFNLSIKVPPLEDQIDRQKLCVVSVKDGKILDYEGGNFQEGKVSCRTRQFGGFALAIDTLPPEITPYNFTDQGHHDPRRALKIRIEDNLSGVAHYELSLNDQWLRAYYDAKNDLLLAEPSDLDYMSGSNVLKMLVRDDKGNESEETVKILLP